MISIKFQLLSLMVISWGFVKSETEYAEGKMRELTTDKLKAETTRVTTRFQFSTLGPKLK